MQAHKREQNITHMCIELLNSAIVQPATSQHTRGLINIFTGQEATHQQSHDLLLFRVIGQKAFEDYVTYRILMIPSSTTAPIRQLKLKTMKKD